MLFQSHNWIYLKKTRAGEWGSDANEKSTVAMATGEWPDFNISLSLTFCRNNGAAPCSTVDAPSLFQNPQVPSRLRPCHKSSRGTCCWGVVATHKWPPPMALTSIKNGVSCSSDFRHTHAQWTRRKNKWSEEGNRSGKGEDQHKKMCVAMASGTAWVGLRPSRRCRWVQGVATPRRRRPSIEPSIAATCYPGRCAGG